MLERGGWIVLFLMCAIWVCAGSQPVAGMESGDVSVPWKYKRLYSELESKLQELNGTIKSKWDGKKRDTAFGLELLVASSNRGEVLLTDRVFQSTVLTLNRVKDLGIQSVALTIQYPLITDSYPRSAEYLKFYKKVADEIHRRGQKVIVKMSTLFQEQAFSKVKGDYKGLTVDRFKEELREMAINIVKEVRPDYLVILSETDTNARNTGLDLSVQNFAATVSYVARGLRPTKVLLGAGAGTWSDLEYFEVLVDIPELDFVDIHIYPIQGDLVVDRVLKVASMARAKKKRITIGEAWLYKVSSRELGRVSFSQLKAFARGVFSFWQPLDEMFVEMAVNLSYHIDADFCSFFWMKYFYNYVAYGRRTKWLGDGKLIQKSEMAAAEQIVNGSINKTGGRFRSLIKK